MTDNPAPAISKEIVEAADLAIERALHGRLGRSMVMISDDEGQRGAAINAILGSVMDDRNYGMPLHGAAGYSLTDQISRMATYVANRIEIDGGPADKLKRVINGFNRAHTGADICLMKTEIGIADSGVLDHDFPVLLEEIGEAAKATDKVIVVPVGEMQEFSKPDMTSILMAVHRANQHTLPIVMVGAGSSDMPRLAGEARSYSERMLDFPTLPEAPQVDGPSALPDVRPDIGEQHAP